MVFGWKRTDPICGMKEEKGKGMHKYGHWFCNNRCLHEYKEKLDCHCEDPTPKKQTSCCK